MAGKSKYHAGYFLLDPERLYTAEHIVYKIEGEGFFPEWEHLAPHVHRRKWYNAVKAIRSYLRTNLYPDERDGGDRPILCSKGEKRSAWLGCKIMATVEERQVPDAYLDKFFAAKRLAEQYQNEPDKLAAALPEYQEGIPIISVHIPLPDKSAGPIVIHDEKPDPDHATSDHSE